MDIILNRLYVINVDYVGVCKLQLSNFKLAVYEMQQKWDYTD